MSLRRPRLGESGIKAVLSDQKTTRNKDMLEYHPGYGKVRLLAKRKPRKINYPKHLVEDPQLDGFWYCCCCRKILEKKKDQTETMVSVTGGYFDSNFERFESSHVCDGLPVTTSRKRKSRAQQAKAAQAKPPKRGRPTKQKNKTSVVVDQEAATNSETPSNEQLVTKLQAELLESKEEIKRLEARLDKAEGVVGRVLALETLTRRHESELGELSTKNHPSAVGIAESVSPASSNSRAFNSSDFSSPASEAATNTPMIYLTQDLLDANATTHSANVTNAERSRGEGKNVTRESTNRPTPSPRPRPGFVTPPPGGNVKTHMYRMYRTR